MSKRFLAIILCVAMCLSLPQRTFAEDGGTPVLEETSFAETEEETVSIEPAEETIFAEPAEESALEETVFTGTEKENVSEETVFTGTETENVSEETVFTGTEKETAAEETVLTGATDEAMSAEPSAETEEESPALLEEEKESYAKVTGLDSSDLKRRREAGGINAVFADPDAPRKSFANLSQLKSLCEKTYSAETIAFCTMESGEFVFTQNLTIPKNLIVVFGIKEKSTYDYTTFDVTVRIPGGVTVTLQGEMAAASLTVDGKLIIETNAYLSGYEFEDLSLTVNGSIENSGVIFVNEISGLDNIVQKNFTLSRIEIDASCSSGDEMINLLDYYDDHQRISVFYNLTCEASVDISEKITVPSNVSLVLKGGGTIRSSGQLIVKGELWIYNYSKSITLTIAGELKNRNSVYIEHFMDYCGKLKLQSGGNYTGDGALMLSAYNATLSIADMLPGFDLSKFSQSTSGSYTKLELSNYTEPWEDGEISSFEELKEMVESGCTDPITKYTGPNPLVIEEDLTISMSQNMHIYPVDVVVPEGVTFTIHSFFSCHNLTVHGTMNAYSSLILRPGEITDFSRANPNTVIVDGALNLYGFDYSAGYYSATLATEYLVGEENIHRLGRDNRLLITRTVENEEALRTLLYEAQSDYKEWKEYCPSVYDDLSLAGDLTIPRGCSLDLYGGTLTVPDGVTLTIYGGMELSGGKVNVQGSLINEGSITVFEDEGEQIRLSDDSCYNGDGWIMIWTSELSARLPGFDLSNYYVYYGKSQKIVLTRSEATYNEIAAGSEPPKEVFYKATAQVDYHQTEARTMLQYVNDFRTGEEAYYNSSDGGVVSLVGTLKPLEYSYSLEEIAMQRAAEIAVQALGNHSRPNGQGFSSLMSSDGICSNGENFGISSYPSVYHFYESLREDDLPYESQGHRRNMLGNYKYMGVGYVEYCGWGFLVQEFGGSSAVAGTESAAVDGMVAAVIEVSSGNVYSYNNVTAEPEAIQLAPGGSTDIPTVSAELFLVDDFMLNTDSPVARVTPEWEIDNTEIAEIRDGKIIGVADGETTLKGTAFGQEVTAPLIVSSSGVNAPVITKQPADHKAELGADVTLQVTASGSALRYQWYYRLKDGADWKEMPSDSAKTDKLSFKALANYNNCDFRCVVQNVAGTATSKAVRLTISAKLNKSSLLLPYFRTETLKLMQADGTGASAYWSSSNTSILAVGPDGTLKPKKCGVVTVKATAGDGRVTASCKVRVIFSDVQTSSKYYYKPVYWAFDNGITQGYTSGDNAGKFGVGLNCVRKDFVLFLYRMAGKPTVSDAELADLKKTFSDVSGLSLTFRSAIAWALKKGITKGYTSGKYAGQFGIEKEITRREALIMIWRYIGKEAPSSAGITAARSFKDVKGVYKESTDSFKAIAWAAGTGVTKGYTKTSSLPAGHEKEPIPCFGCDFSCLREDMIVFLYRTANLK